MYDLSRSVKELRCFNSLYKTTLRNRYNLPILCLLVLSLTACSSRPNIFSDHQEERLRRLDSERAQLKRINNPVGKTKVYIRISDLMISFVADAIKNNDSEMMEDRLEGYRTAIQNARDTMMNSGRDASRKASGFRDLEIALRQQLRRLDDMGSQLTLEYRETIDVVVTEVSGVRDELLRALFPDGENAKSSN